MSERVLSDVQNAWLRRAEFLALIAVLVLGIGMGALAASALSTVAVPILLVGCFTVAWAMVQKQRVEVLSGGPPALWERALYWACWAAIGIVAAIVIWKSLGLT
ncbi:MAG: hypothetical protein K2X43_18335 [Hyphomonadaceae bacterium]|jgi:hypothetical protein|nr:hypothetical protein [Hyphomonadaceae bacterium]